MREIKKRLFGIQKKLLLYVMLLITVVLIVVAVSVSIVAGRDTRKNLIEQYTYMNDKFNSGFQTLYENVNTAMENCITNSNVQKSLKNKEISIYDREVISRTLGFIGSSYTDYYVYMDNKQNFYSQTVMEGNAEALLDSYLYKGLGDDYSKTKFFWESDVFLGKDKKALFAGRYVRQFERNYEPGLLYMKLDEKVFDDMLDEVGNGSSVFFLLDGKGQICYGDYPARYEKNEQNLEAQVQEAASHITAGDGQTIEIASGLLFAKKQADTGFITMTFVANAVINQVVWEMLTVILLIFLAVLVLAFFISRYFAAQFTQPIRYISSLMESFDDSRLRQMAEMHTDTELDYIGHSYNNMLERIGGLLAEVKYKERELRKAELDTLLYQIQPHFLYNTLDTVYMLARISREKTIMSMIQSLSRYLRITLSNGAEEIPVREELEQVKAYLDIQKIRNSDLFTYEISCEEAIEEIRVLKMILQPAAENCIKHAFSGMEEGGHIRITATEEGDELVFVVENNGRIIADKECDRLNRLEHAGIEEIDRIVTREKGGYGICNVVKRLRLRYQEQIRFYYVAAAEKTSCIMKIKKEMIRTHEETED